MIRSILIICGTGNIGVRLHTPCTRAEILSYLWRVGYVPTLLTVSRGHAIVSVRRQAGPEAVEGHLNVDGEILV